MLGTGEKTMGLNRERIIRGLECCKGSYDCFTCDIYKRGCAGFREGLAKDALSLIKELTEENERLRADKDYWKSRAKESESEYDQAVKRGYNLGAIDYVGSFAERLKAEAITIQDHTGKLGSVILVSTIDQIAKEMEESVDEG